MHHTWDQGRDWRFTAHVSLCPDMCENSLSHVTLEQALNEVCISLHYNSCIARICDMRSTQQGIGLSKCLCITSK